MKVEKGIISGKQLMFLIIVHLQASTLAISFIASLVNQSLWIIISFTFILMFIFFWIYLKISLQFPGLNLIEINDILYGKIIGKVVSLLYIYFFWYIAAANLRFIADFFSAFLYQGISNSVFIISFALVLVYTVRNGLETFGRCSVPLAILNIVLTIFITILTIKDWNLKNFLPLFNIELIKILQSANLMIAIPFGEMIVFMMIFPYVNEQTKVKKYFYLGYIIGFINLILIIIRNIAVLGNITSLYLLPSFQVARIINVGEIIVRAEIVIAVVLLFNSFIKICIFLYVTVLGLAQLFRMKYYKPLVLPIGVLISVFADSMYNSSTEHGYSGANIYPVYALLFIIFIPIITFILMYIKKFSK